MGWGGGTVCLPIRHLPFYEEFTASCGQSRTSAHSSLEEGERETQLETERERRTDNLGDRLPSLPPCSSAKWKECSFDEPVSLFTPRHDKEKSNGLRQDGQDEVGFNYVAYMNFILSLLVAI